jgi:hypothetical protein
MAEHETRFYTDPTEWAEGVAWQYLRHRATLSRPNGLVISDVDDVMIHSSGRWYADFVELAVEKGMKRDVLPDLKTFIERSPRVCFTELELVKDYSSYKARQMQDVAFHLGMGAVDSAAAALPGFAGRNLPEGYLSTRPAVLGAATSWQLKNLGFAPTPLLVRPETVAYENTVEFKVDALQTLRFVLEDAALASVPVEYVDDYGAVVDAVNDLGQDVLTATHFGPGASWQEIVDRHI